MSTLNILLATDGSDCARVAGELLAGLPLPAHARVTVLSVVPGSAWLASDPIGGEAGLYPWLADFHKEEDRAARCTAEAAADLLRERGIDAQVCIRRQSPAEGILEQARESRADLILVGSHGKGAVERFMVGSVSERVARYASASVLVVRGSAVRRVIVGVDGSESSEHALEALRRIPLPAEAEIRVLHALHEERIYPVPIVPGVRMESVFESYDREHRAEGERIVRHACSRLDLRDPDAATALQNARDVYTRRQEGVSIWVVPAAQITASSPDEKDAYFDPAADKIYRHPTFYHVPEGAKHL